MFQELSSRCLTWNICILCSTGYIRTHNSNKSVNYTTKRSPRKWGRRHAAVPAGQLALHDYLPLSVSSVSLSASSLSLSSFDSCWSVLPAIIPSFNSFFNHVGACRKKKTLTTFSITCPLPRSKNSGFQTMFCLHYKTLFVQGVCIYFWFLPLLRWFPTRRSSIPWRSPTQAPADLQSYCKEQTKLSCQLTQHHFITFRVKSENKAVAESALLWFISEH